MPLYKEPIAAFALTTDGEDLFFMMTTIAAQSVRITNPSCRILFFLDSQSHDTLGNSQQTLLNSIGCVRPVPTPSGCPTFRNRWVKTTLHRYIKEPFTYLDGDVLVRSSLAGLMEATSTVSFAAAENHSSPIFEEQTWVEDINVFDCLGWPRPEQTYFNGGVLFFRSDLHSTKIAEAWHCGFLESYQKTGRPRDQPALNFAIGQNRTHVRTLPVTFNAQFKKRPRCASGAAIWHYYASANDVPVTAYEALIRQSDLKQPIAARKVKKLIRAKDPYRRSQLGDFLIARRILRQDCVTLRELEWYQSTTVQNVLNSLRRLIKIRL